MNLYLDIETIPTQLESARAAIAETVSHPANITKAESIAAWNAEKRPDAIEAAIGKTSFDGAYGHICCIGWAWDDEEPQSVSLKNDVAHEHTLLKALASEIDDRTNGGMRHGLTVIGHNVVQFDIRFIWQRAIILGVPMPLSFPRDPKPWGDDVFDTQTAFAGARGMIGMDRLCAALGMPGKGDVDGSQVAGMWAAGKHDEIATYCREDVERTRAIHRRMEIAYGRAA